MKIRNRLYVNAGISLLAIIILLLSFNEMKKKTCAELQVEKIANQLFFNISDLILLKNEYPTERSYDQFQVIYSRSMKLLEENRSIKGVKKLEKEFQKLHDGWIALKKEHVLRQINNEIWVKDDKQRSDLLIKALISKQLVHIRNILTASHNISQQSKENLEELHSNSFKLFWVLSTILFLVNVISAIWTSAKISTPICQLISITKNIRRAGYENTIRFPKKEKPEDEIDELGIEFNKILTALDDTLVQLQNELEEKNIIEKDLSNLQKFLDNIINSMPSALIAVEKSDKITLWNNRAEKMSGIPKTEALGGFLSEISCWIEIEKEQILRCIHSKEIVSENFKAKKEDSKTSYHDITIYPLIIDDLEGAVIRVDDVTEQRTILDQLNHKRKMDAIGQLAGGIAHDFNNMLGGILTSASILNTTQQLNEEKKSRLLEIIVQAAEKATNLTDKLLAFGRKRNHETSIFSIHQVLDDTIALLERTLHKSIHLEFNKSAENDYVIGDSSSIQSTFINLAINGSHAMPEGGDLVISTRNLVVSNDYCEKSSFLLKPGLYIEIEIRDTGAGIPVGNLEKIFEPFFTTKEIGKGTGLGLAAAYGAVKEHQGEITVSSKNGEGSRFCLLFPCSRENLLKTEKLLEKAQPGSGTILLIDDEEVVRLSTQMSLERLGYKVLLSANAKESLLTYAKNLPSIDLVITDMLMPETTGFELFYRLKKINPDCRILVISGFTRDEDLQKLYDDGLKGFVQKPYTEIELSKAVFDSLH